MSKYVVLYALAFGAFVAGMNLQPSDAGWQCGTKRCFWKADYNGPVPPFAASWAAPESPTCYYVQRRISKRWAKVCPEVDIRAR